MANFPEEVKTVIIEKGKGVISAIRGAFPGLSRGEVITITKSACAELKGKIPKGDICAIVQPGQVVKIQVPEKINPPQNPNKWEDASGKYERAVFDGKPTGAIAYKPTGASNTIYLYPNSNGIYVGFEHIPKFEWKK